MRINILLYCPDAAQLQHLEQLISREEGWEHTGTTSDEQAIELFNRERFDLIILAGDIAPAIDAKLKKLFTMLDRHINILNFYGGDDWFLRVQVSTILKLDEPEGPVIDNPF